MGLIIILASIAATTHMMLLSYVFSAHFRTLYNEPLFLQTLLLKLGSPLSEKLKEILRWCAHYFVGLVFVICFYFLLEYEIIGLSWWSGLEFGIIAGLIVAEWWYKMLKISKLPCIDSKKYYRQLLCTHIVFGITVVAVFKFLIE